MSTIPFEAFLAKFSQLKSRVNRVNSNPLNLRWRAKNDPSLGELAYELEEQFRRVAFALASLSRKAVVPPTRDFKTVFDEYRERWASEVSKTSQRWLEARLAK